MIQWALFGLYPYLESLWMQYNIVMHLSFTGELKNWNFHLHFWHDWSGLAPVRYSMCSLFWVVLHTLLHFHPSRMTCIEYISELPCSLAFICVQDISEKEERMVRGYPQVLCLLGLLGQSVSAMKILFPFCLKVASSPGFSAVSKSQSYTTVGESSPIFPHLPFYLQNYHDNSFNNHFACL